MTKVVFDTSALVSLASTRTKNLLTILDRDYEMFVPEQVVEELEEMASYDDEQARAARRALDAVDKENTHSVDLDSEFPLDRGENAAVTLANLEDADMFLCDEFNQIGLIHASLSDVRLVTTPKLLEVFVHRGVVSRSDAATMLDEISELRSWEGNSYVARVREVLQSS